MNPKSYQFKTYPSHDEEYFVDIQTASQTVGVKPKTLYAWAGQRKIPHYRANGKLLFNIKEIIDFVKKGRINIAAANSEAKIIIGNTLGFRNNPPDSGQVVSRRRRKHV